MAVLRGLLAGHQTLVQSWDSLAIGVDSSVVVAWHLALLGVGALVLADSFGIRPNRPSIQSLVRVFDMTNPLRRSGWLKLAFKLTTLRSNRTILAKVDRILANFRAST